MNKKIYKFGYIALLLAITIPSIAQNNTEDSLVVTDEWSIGSSTKLQVVKPNNKAKELKIINYRKNNVTTIKNFEVSINKKNSYKQEKNRGKRGNFEGHWSGVYIGLTNYLQGGEIYGSNGDDMRLDWSGSRTFIINPYNADISLSRNGCFGMAVGVGFEYQRLSFSDDYTSITKGDKGVIIPISINNQYNVRRNTLKHLYLTVPILFEVQSRKAFVSAGVIGGLRLHSKTKVVYDYEGDKRKMKNTDDFSMVPFKLDATAKIGYGCFAVFCNYTLTKMFEKNKGADLHPLTIGFGFVWGI